MSLFAVSAFCDCICFECIHVHLCFYCLGQCTANSPIPIKNQNDSFLLFIIQIIQWLRNPPWGVQQWLRNQSIKQLCTALYMYCLFLHTNLLYTCLEWCWQVLAFEVKTFFTISKKHLFSPFKIMTGAKCNNLLCAVRLQMWQALLFYYYCLYRPLSPS